MCRGVMVVLLVAPMEYKVFSHLTVLLLSILDVASQLSDLTCTVAPTPLTQEQMLHTLMVM